MGNFDQDSYWLGRDSRRAGGVAGAGLGLGAAGTALGVFNAMANGGGLFGGWNNGWNRGWNGGCGWNGNQNFDMAVNEALAQKDSKIAQLEAEKYSDQNGLQLYKYFDAKIEAIEKRFCQQEVYNATLNGAIGTLGGQINELKTIVGGITRTAVPSDAICDFNAHSSCNTCSRQTA